MSMPESNASFFSFNLPSQGEGNGQKESFEKTVD